MYIYIRAIAFHIDIFLHLVTAECAETATLLLK